MAPVWGRLVAVSVSMAPIASCSAAPPAPTPPSLPVSPASSAAPAPAPEPPGLGDPIVLAPSLQGGQEQGFAIAAVSTSFGRVVLATRPESRWRQPCPIDDQPPSCAFVTVGLWKRRPVPGPFPEEAEIDVWTAPVAVEPTWRLSAGSTVAFLVDDRGGLRISTIDERGAVTPARSLPASVTRRSLSFARVLETSRGAVVVGTGSSSAEVGVAELGPVEGGLSLGPFTRLGVSDGPMAEGGGLDGHWRPNAGTAWAASPVFDERGKLTELVELTWRGARGSYHAMRFTSRGKIIRRAPPRPGTWASGPRPAEAPALPSPPPLLGPPPQQIEAAGFDEKSGEGLVVWREAQTEVAQPIDARGRPSGEPLRSEATLEPRIAWLTRLARSAVGWAMVEQGGGRLQVLSGPRAGAAVALSPGMRRGSEGCDEQPECLRRWGELIGVFPDGDDVVAVHRDQERRSDVWLTRVDLGRARASEPVLLEAGGQGGPFVDEVTDDAGLAGSPMLLGHSPLGAPVVWTKGAGWVPLALPDEAKLGQVRWRRLFGAWVAVVNAPGGAFASWLGKGVARAIGSASWEGLPSSPDELVASHLLPDPLVERCPSSLATGPRRRVFVCEEAASTEGPMIAVRTREARF